MAVIVVLSKGACLMLDLGIILLSIAGLTAMGTGLFFQWQHPMTNRKWTFLLVFLGMSISFAAWILIICHYVGR